MSYEHYMARPVGERTANMREACAHIRAALNEATYIRDRNLEGIVENIQQRLAMALRELGGEP